MDWLVGTSGYSYKEWIGSFYPDGTKPAGMLSYYASQFGTVEINNTFYRMPKADVVEGWGSQVGDGFRFVLKASRRITHIKRLKEVADDVRFLCEQAAVLGPKLGALLFQLPPNAKADKERLAAFLKTLPGDVRVALEFRHPSWMNEDVYARLREHGAALCFSDGESEDDTQLDVERIINTADWAYLRLRRESYSDDDLARVAARVKASGAQQAFVFFKHEDEGTGPSLARRFLERAAAG